MNAVGIELEREFFVWHFGIWYDARKRQIAAGVVSVSLLSWQTMLVRKQTLIKHDKKMPFRDICFDLFHKFPINLTYYFLFSQPKFISIRRLLLIYKPDMCEVSRVWPISTWYDRKVKIMPIISPAQHWTLAHVELVSLSLFYLLSYESKFVYVSRRMYWR